MLMYLDTEVINYITGEGVKRHLPTSTLMYFDTKVINYIDIR